MVKIGNAGNLQNTTVNTEVSSERRFDYFIVLSDKFAGSVLLESRLNSFARIECLGEAFNPHFIGSTASTITVNLTLEQRTLNPMILIDKIRKHHDKIRGFRFFYDHDPRVLEYCLEDPRCAKIILTRNPVESYISQQTAHTVEPSDLADVELCEGTKVLIDPEAFEKHLAIIHDFQNLVMKRLQVSGQSAFNINYDSLQCLDVINGISKFLNANEQFTSCHANLKHPAAINVRSMIQNIPDFQATMLNLDWFNLEQPSVFEARRGAMIPRYVGASKSSLLYMPIPEGPDKVVLDWMAALDGVGVGDLLRDFKRKSLRSWKNSNKGYRSFTILRHPVQRVYEVFCTKIFAPNTPFRQIRKNLRRIHGLPIPEKHADADYDISTHRSSFIVFLKFVKMNLFAQTRIRQDAHWGQQQNIIKGFADLSLPDVIIREGEMTNTLSMLALQVGQPNAPKPRLSPLLLPYTLADVYDEQIELLCSEIYEQDYLNFGFDRWKAAASI